MNKREIIHIDSFVWTWGHLGGSLEASGSPLSNICLILFPQELPYGVGNNINDLIFDHWYNAGFVKKRKWKIQPEFILISNKLRPSCATQSLT